MAELNESRKIRFGGHIETTTVRPPVYVLVVCAERQERDGFIPTRFIYKGNRPMIPGYHTLGSMIKKRDFRQKRRGGITFTSDLAEVDHINILASCTVGTTSVPYHVTIRLCIKICLLGPPEPHPEL